MQTGSLLFIKYKTVHMYHGTTCKVRLNGAWESGTAAAKYTGV